MQLLNKWLGDSMPDVANRDFTLIGQDISRLKILPFIDSNAFKLNELDRA